MPSMNQRYFKSTEDMDAVEGAECTCLIQLLSSVAEQVKSTEHRSANLTELPEVESFHT